MKQPSDPAFRTYEEFQQVAQEGEPWRSEDLRVAEKRIFGTIYPRPSERFFQCEEALSKFLGYLRSFESSALLFVANTAHGDSFPTSMISIERALNRVDAEFLDTVADLLVVDPQTGRWVHLELERVPERFELRVATTAIV